MGSISGKARRLMGAGAALALAGGGLVAIAPAAHAETITVHMDCSAASNSVTAITVTQGDTLVVDGRDHVGNECTPGLNIPSPFSGDIVDPPGYVENPVSVFTFEILNTAAVGQAWDSGWWSVSFQSAGPGVNYLLDVTIQARASNTPAAPVTPTVPLYTLGYDANGGSCSVSSGSALSGVWLTLPTADQCSRSGYTLAGWNTSSDNSGLAFGPGGATVMSSDNTVFAIWQQDVATGASGSGSSSDGTASKATKAVILVKWKFVTGEPTLVDGDVAALDAHPACFTIVAESAGAVTDAMVQAAMDLAAAHHGTYAGIVESKDWHGAHIVAAYEE